jgi:DNA-directed RNA polymerase subunit K/omega
MTYVPRREVTDVIANKFEAIRVLALECRRLNDEMRAREETSERKITTMAFERLRNGGIKYYDARERREQERSEAMLNAAELLLDIENMDIGDEDEDEDDDLLDAAEDEAADATDASDASDASEISEDAAKE